MSTPSFKVFKVGDKVKVAQLTDPWTVPHRFLGRQGTVLGFNTNGTTGNTKDDPLIEVGFAPGDSYHFWREELQEVH